MLGMTGVFVAGLVSPRHQSVAILEKPVPVAVITKAALPTPSRTDEHPRGNWTTVKAAYARRFEDLYLNPGLNRLHLTRDQITALQECFNHLSQSRLSFEASIATVSQVNGDVYIEIPAYPKEGARLEAEFLNELDTAVGADVAAKIANEYLPQIESENSNMGNETQELLASKDSDNAGRLKVSERYTATDGSFNGTRVSQLTPDDMASFGALATFFPRF